MHKKGQGQGAHVSNFLTETIGPLKQDSARIIMVLGVNRDGYWNGEKLVTHYIGQLMFLKERIPIVLAFGHLIMRPHTAHPAGVLVASKMNKGPGGSVPKCVTQSGMDNGNQ